jgi:hypothetical protein
MIGSVSKSYKLPPGIERFVYCCCDSFRRNPLVRIFDGCDRIGAVASQLGELPFAQPTPLAQSPGHVRQLNTKSLGLARQFGRVVVDIVDS